MNIFQRAHQGLNLSPEERAFLKLVKGFIITAAAAALSALAAVITNGATLHDSIVVVGVTFAVTLLNAAAKYFSANGQAPLGAVIQGVATTIENHYPEIPVGAGSNTNAATNDAGSSAPSVPATSAP